MRDSLVALKGAVSDRKDCWLCLLPDLRRAFTCSFKMMISFSLVLRSLECFLKHKYGPLCNKSASYHL